MNHLHGQIFLFGSFRMDVPQRMLWRNGDHLPLPPKEFETLLVLLEAGGQSVSKEAIVSKVWPDTFVGDSSLTRNISVLRKLLGDDVIQTQPKFGYRLSLPVSQMDPATVEVQPAALGGATIPVPESADVLPPHGLLRGGRSSAPPETGNAGIAPAHRSRGAVWMALAFLIGISAFFAYRQGQHLRAKPHLVTGPIRIAVLPFVNLTGDGQQEYVCDGLTEAMIAELSRVSPGHLDVIARTSAMQYKHNKKSIVEIGRELNVTYVLESTLRESGRRIRVTTQLVRAADAGHVWTGEYDRDLKDVLTAQQAVAIAITREIELALEPAAVQQEPAVDAEAYRDDLLGRFYWNRRDRDGLLKSVEYFQRAIARDPKYARAYSGLADAYLVLGGGYLPDRETYNKGRAAAMRALELDPGLAAAWCALAYEKFVNERDWPGADENYQRAIRLDPGYATAHHWYALYLAAMLRRDEALREIRRALALDPLSVAVNYNAGSILTQAGRFDEAIAQFQKTLEIDPKNATTHGGLAAAYERKKLYAQAAHEFETAQKLSGGYSPYAVELVHVYALDGETSKARRVLARLLADDQWGKAAPLSFARAYAVLGEKEEAFRWFQKSIDDRSCTVAEVNTDPDLNPLRSDPRFQEIRREFHLQ